MEERPGGEAPGPGCHKEQPMKNETADRERRTDAEIIDAGDDGEILTDGGVDAIEPTDPPEANATGTPAAHIQTLAAAEEATIEVGQLEDLTELRIRNAWVEGVVYLDDEDVDELIAALEAIKASPDNYFSALSRHS